MSTLFRFAGLALCLLIAIGCGDDPVVTNNTEPADPESSNVEPQEIPEFADDANELLAAQCETMIRCCGTAGLEDAFGFQAGDVEECVQVQQSGFMGGVGGSVMEDSWVSDRVEFNKGMADACAESLRSIGCGEFQGTEEERESLGGCSDVITGLVGVGGECMGDWECQDDSVCVFADIDASQGTCEALPGEGQPCVDRTCGGMNYCDSLDDTCYPTRPDGEPCSEHKMCISGHCDSIEQSDGSTIRECGEPAPVCG